MMKRNKSRKSTSLKFLFALPAIALGMLSVATYSFNPVINNANQFDSGININNTIQIPDNDTVYKVVHKTPDYVGGRSAMMAFIRDNIKYPEEARKQDVKGTVYVSFVVEKDGSLSKIKILRGIGSGCDKEVLRVMKLMPKWMPGEDESGKPVRVAFNLPVKFNLDDDKKEEKP